LSNENTDDIKSVVDQEYTPDIISCINNIDKKISDNTLNSINTFNRIGYSYLKDINEKIKDYHVLLNSDIVKSTSDIT